MAADGITNALITRTGSALIWKSVQLASTKGIFLVRTVVLARLLAPEEFGLLAIATVAVGFLLNVTDLGLEPALVQREGAERRHFDAAWTAGMIRALLISAVVFFAAPLIAAGFGEPRATDLIRAMAIMPLLDAAASINIARLTRALQFRSLALAKLGMTLVNTVVAISLATTLGVWALVAGQLLASACYMALSYVIAPYRPRLLLDLDAIMPLIRFGKWIFVIGVFSVIAGSLLQMVISRQLSATELGLYVLASRLAFLPYDVASEVAGAVAFPLYSQLQSEPQRARQAFQGFLTGIAILLVPLCALLIALAPALVANVLGPGWSGTAPIIRVLAVASILGLFTDAVMPTLKGLGLPHQVAALEGIKSATLIMLVWWLTGQFGVVGAAMAWLPAIFVSQLLALAFIKGALARPLAGLGGPAAAVGAASVIGAALALELATLLPGLIGLGLGASVGAAAVVATLWAIDRGFGLGLASSLPRLLPKLALFSRVVSRTERVRTAE
jgi:lipopolysaccharide exporter